MFTYNYHITIRDINYGNHVGVDSLTNILHEARLQFLKTLGNFSEITIIPNIGLILSDIHIKFFKQLVYADNICIEISVVDLKKFKFTLQYRVYHNSVLTHTATTTLSCFNYLTQTVVVLPEVFSKILHNNQQED